MSNTISFHWFPNTQEGKSTCIQKFQGFTSIICNNIDTMANDHGFGIMKLETNNYYHITYAIYNKTLILRHKYNMDIYLLTSFLKDIMTEAFKKKCFYLDCYFKPCSRGVTDFYKIKWVATQNKDHGIIPLVDEDKLNLYIEKFTLISHREIRDEL